MRWIATYLWQGVSGLLGLGLAASLAYGVKVRIELGDARADARGAEAQEANCRAAAQEAVAQAHEGWLRDQRELFAAAEAGNAALLAAVRETRGAVLGLAKEYDQHAEVVEFVAGCRFDAERMRYINGARARAGARGAGTD